MIMNSPMKFAPLLLTLCATSMACSPASNPAVEGSGGTGSTGEVDMGSGGMGVGAQTNSGGSDAAQGSGGAGTSGSGAQTGSGGGSGATTGSGGAGATSSGGSTSGVECSSLAICDDFESTAAGMAPDPTIWTLELGWANDQSTAANVQISDADAHSGTKSVKIENGMGAPYNFFAAPPDDTFYTRAWIKMVSPSGSGSLQAVGSNHNDSEIRFRLFEDTVTLNSAGGDGLNPDPFNCGANCVPTPTDWFCLEMYYDGTTDSATLWIDGVEAAQVENNMGWHSGGNFADAATKVWFGTLWHQGSAPVTYIDDVAVHTARIGCE